MYDLRSLSDISDDMDGVRVKNNDVIIPRQYYKVMLAAYPKLVEEIDAWFKWRYPEQSVVIVNFRGE